MYWHCVLSLCCCYCCVLLCACLCVCLCVSVVVFVLVCLSWLSCHLCHLLSVCWCGWRSSAVALPPWWVRGCSYLLAAPFQLMWAITPEHVFARTYVRWNGRATRPAVKRVIRRQGKRTKEQNEHVFVCSPRKREWLFWIVWQFSYSKVRKW